MKSLGITIAAVVALSVIAETHHSFAVFFDDTKSITVTGAVTEFRFTNPHGVIAIAVKKDGKEEIWRAETYAPTILTRRGWTKTSPPRSSRPTG